MTMKITQGWYEKASDEDDGFHNGNFHSAAVTKRP